METEHINVTIVVILTVGFAYASLLGYVTMRIGLSPLLGYLIAGYLIGPYSPGYEADLKLAEELAEIGVILMMFGVGMHFSIKDLLSVKKIAIPGAILQVLVATIAGTYLIHSLGWSIEAGILFGLALSVASTVILMRGLTDKKMINSHEGHIAVGWLVVEDIITIVVLLLVPTLAASAEGASMDFPKISMDLGLALIKFMLLIVVVFTVGRWLISRIFIKIIQLHSHELFILTFLAITFGIATASAFIFGTSMALGAFIAGMVIGQTELKRKVMANSTPLQDTFIVIFFLSIGMLFNPLTIAEHFGFFLSVLGIILILKPLTAFLITILMRYPWQTALTIAVGLAQIGEFSFIVAEAVTRYDILPDDGYDIIVACALISIAINPLLFKLLPKSIQENAVVARS